MLLHTFDIKTLSNPSSLNPKNIITTMDILSNPYILTALSASLILLLVQFLFRKLNKSNNSNNSMKKKYHPVAGTVFNQMMNFNRLHHYMTDLARKYKTYRLLNFFRNEVYTAERATLFYCSLLKFTENCTW
jgi:hypothetical protein